MPRSRAKDAASNTDATPASRSWTVDDQEPVSEITSGPSGPSNSSTATFAFSSESGASFECSLDDGAWNVCSSPRQYPGLSQGSHTFEVRATDRSSNIGEEVSRAWEVDATAPTVTGMTPRKGAKNVARDATISVTFSEAMDEASVERPDAFKLRKQGSVRRVSANLEYDSATNTLTLIPARQLDPGATYVMRVGLLAEDEAGNGLDRSRVQSFTVKK